MTSLGTLKRKSNMKQMRLKKIKNISGLIQQLSRGSYKELRLNKINKSFL